MLVVSLYLLHKVFLTISMFSLQHKTAVITGAGSGIGKAIAQLLARQGATVHVLDLNETAAQQTANEILAENNKAIAHAVNVTNQQQVKEALVGIAQQAGRIDILVNSAGISHIGKLDTTSEEDFERIFQVNVKGVYNTMYAAVPLMKTQGGGVILNMASIASGIGIADRFAYSMSKGAVLSMTLSVAKDYLKDNIRCNCISPARVHTSFVDNFLAKNYPGKEAEMFDKLSKSQPIGRMGKPDEVAALALYLCSDEASFVTGSDYPIDGGFIKLSS